MGQVYEVRDLRDGQILALKRQNEREATHTALLKREFRRARALRHPHLVRLFDLHVDDQLAFFTMEKVDGVDFVTAVRGQDTPVGPLPPQYAPRLLRLVGQLLDAVDFLHDAGVLHRDLKPSNVMVGGDTLKVLDFGLASLLSSPLKSEKRPAGTLVYLAPEQLWGQPASRASDLYSVGAMLYAALLGELPFGTEPLDVVLGKKSPPDRLPLLERGVYAELARQTCALLRPQAERRPTTADLRRALALSAPRALPRVFVGRELELGRLADGMQRERRSVVQVFGPAGIGKTTLVQEALANAHRWTVLRCRCHPDERVPFKTVDGVVEELALWMKDEARGESFRPLSGLPALLELFPTLGGLPGWEASDDDLAADPVRRRREGARALAQVLGALTRTRALAIWVDDLQWGDADSVPLLDELVRGPHAPPVTWIFSHRPPGGEAVPALAWLAEVAGRHVVPVTPFTPEEVTDLATLLGVEADPGLLAQARSPFFVTAVAMAGEGGDGSLAGAIRARRDRLDPGARGLLELVLVGAPLALEVAADATEGALRDHLDQLESAALVRRTAKGRLAPWHDKVGELLIPELDGERHATLHGRLAAALLDRPEPDARALARHFGGARARPEARHWHGVAAEDAAAILAFDEAAWHYRQALQLGEPDEALLHGLAENLDRIGEAEAAAGAWATAATLATSPERERELTLLSGTRLLYSGRLEDGKQALVGLMEQRGAKLPTKPLVSGLLGRLGLLLRGKRLQLRDEGHDPARVERARLLLETAGGLFMVEPVLADALAVQGLRQALALGHRELLIQALGFECSSEANLGGKLMRQRVAWMMELLDELVHTAPTPALTAGLSLTRGAVALFETRFDDAAAASLRALRQLPAEIPGAVLQRNAAAAFLVAALATSGRIAELGELLDELRQTARARGDRYGEVALATAQTFYPDLAADRPERARARCDAALARWPAEGFSSPHYQAAYLRASCLLYEGRADEALQGLDEAWPLLKQHSFLALDWLGHQLRHLRGRLLVATGDLAGARKEHKAMAKSQLQAVRALRASLGGCIDGEPATALAELDAAALHGFAACARLRAGGAEAEAAAAWFAAEGVRRPDRLADLLVPLP